MSQWQIYEVTRSNSDVILFARDMVEDVAMCAHLDRCIRSNPPFLRDSFGLWLRFYAMAKEGELKLSPEHFRTYQERAEHCNINFTHPIAKLKIERKSIHIFRRIEKKKNLSSMIRVTHCRV